MRDLSTITGQELPSGKSLLLSTLIALAVAAVLLLLAVLPAEYGFDPTGLGKRMGLTALHKPDDHHEDTHSHAGADHEAATHSHTNAADNPAMTDDTALGLQATAPTQVLQKRGEKWRSDKLELTLSPKQGSELKVLLDQGEKMLFQWSATNGAVSFDMHGNAVAAAEGDFTSFWVGEGENQASGVFTAPFSGLHGWWWENKTDRPVSITLEIEGYYKDLVQY